MTKKILLSIGTMVFVGALAIGATGAFFSDTETSTGNTFTAGAIDLKIDSTSHYNNMVCTPGQPNAWQPEVGAFPNGVPVDHYPQPGTPCDGTWAETDLGVTNKFFNLTDIKPGDSGEDTISLHVYGNDSWGRFVINGVTDLDNSCTEPESEVGAAEPECPTPNPSPAITPGELAESITFYAWLDQGGIPGFQNIGANGVQIDGNGGTPGTPLVDSTEGDNIWQCLDDEEIQLVASAWPAGFDPQFCDEPLVILPGTVDENLSPDQTLADETHNIWPALSAVFTAYCSLANPQGADNYGPCQGIAADGRLVGSTTYYFGLPWSVPTTVGNEAQTDSLNANLIFQAVQQRNNPSQTF